MIFKIKSKHYNPYFFFGKLKNYTETYISIKMDPKGRIPPNITMTRGSINHFFSGIGLGTAFTRQG
jgi:hypothetical protein